MTAERSRFNAGVAGRALLAVVAGMLAGGVFNASLGDQGADTPAFSLLGGAVALGVLVAVNARRRAREVRND